MDNNDILTLILGFFARMLGSLMDPISLPFYIAFGVFFKRYILAISSSIGFYIIARILLSVIESHQEGIETRINIGFASFVGAVLFTSLVYLIASMCRKNKRKPDA